MNAVREFNEMSFDSQTGFDMSGLKDMSFDMGPVNADSNEADGKVASEKNQNQGYSMDIGMGDVLSLFAPAPIAFMMQAADITAGAMDEAAYQNNLRSAKAANALTGQDNQTTSFNKFDLSMKTKGGMSFQMSQGKPSDTDGMLSRMAPQNDYTVNPFKPAAPRLG